MSEPSWHVERDRADRTIVVRIDRPEARNAISRATMNELDDLISELAEDSQIGCVVLTGAGDKAFIAGGDLKDFSRLDTPQKGQEMGKRMQEILNRWESLPVPTIAAIGANAYGGGCEIALACDLRVMAAGTHLVFSQARLGLLTGWGGASRLVGIVGKGRAMEILTTGRYVSAEKAQAMGLATDVAPEGYALAHALDLARQITRHPREAIRGMKEAVLAGTYETKARAQQVENEWFGKRWNSPEHKGAVARFLGGGAAVSSSIKEEAPKRGEG